MREKTAVLLCGLFLSVAVQALPVSAHADAPKTKEWTFLVYLNGNNNLDSFGAMNINQMEQVGSTDDVNVVVQWASIANQKTERLYVVKDNDSTKVTSPVVQDMGKVDMGDWKSLVDFIKWGAANYPAKHYFVDVWDHGSGWHAITTMGFGFGGHRGGSIFHPTDISWDDTTGNFMTTQQLGQAIAEGSKAIGQKIDIYGSDACLMAMAEVADEMKDSVSYFVGSQEVEPGAGWPYDAFLKRLAARPTMSPSDASKAMVEEYVKSYQNGENGSQEVTFSAFDMSQLDQLIQAVSSLGASLQKLDKAARAKVVDAATHTQSFAYADYGDLVDFIDHVDAAAIPGIESRDLSDVKAAVKNFVIANADTTTYAKATGLSIWLPSNTWDYQANSDKYASLAFEKESSWGEALKYMLQDLANPTPTPDPSPTPSPSATAGPIGGLH